MSASCILSEHIKNGRPDLLKAALSEGSDPNGLPDRPSPLHVTCWEHNNTVVDCMKLLLEYGADVNVRRPNADSPLLYALINRRKRFAWLLLDYGACVDKHIWSFIGHDEWLVPMTAHRLRFQTQCYNLLSIGSKSPLVCKDVIGLVAKHLFSMRIYETEEPRESLKKVKH